MLNSTVVPVSVAIPCFEGQSRLLRTLEVLARCVPAPAEVLIHADGGWKPELPVDRDWPWAIRVLHSEKAIGPGGGRQRLIEAAAHDVVASFDDDAWPLDTDYFAKALAVMEAFPSCAVMSPAVSLPNQRGPTRAQQAWEARCYEGSASVHRRSLHLTLPGFVPVQGAYGLEEADLSLQARTRGLLILACPWLQAWHERPMHEDAHGLCAWIRNELVLGWLRFPRLLQPWSWVRALKRLRRDSRKVSPLSLLRSALTAPALCAEFCSHQSRARLRPLLKHYQGPLRGWNLATGSQGLLAEELPSGRRMLFIQFTDPGGYPPLEHVTEILSSTGWDMRFIGVRVGDLKLRAHPRVETVMRPRAQGGLATKVQFVGWTLTCVWHAWRWRPTRIYASDWFACLPALIAHWTLRIPVIYHEHDSPPEGRSSLFTRLLSACRRRMGHCATAVVFPCAGRMSAFKAMAAPQGPCFVVWNTPTVSEVLPLPRAPLKQGLRVLFHGSIVPERFPLAYVELLKQCHEDITMGLIGYETAGAVGYTQRLKATAATAGLADRFQCHPPVPERSDLLAHCAGYDLGLALLKRRDWDINSIHMAGASNKPFDYASQGLAVLVPDESEWRELFVDTGCGLACAADDVAGIARLLNHLQANPELVRAMGERGRQTCLTTWNYEHQFAMVQRLIESDINTASRQWT